MSENTITVANVHTLHQVFQTTLPDIADGSPVLAGAVNTPSGKRNMIFASSQAGDLVAIDADTGAIVWKASHPAGNCRINNGSSPCYTTSSPAIDPSIKFVYVYGLDGAVHKHDIATGAEVIGSNWPVVTSLKAFDEKGSSALSTATDKAGENFLYVSHAGYPGDNGDYQGHVTTIRIADGTPADGTSNVFNTLCSNQAVHFVHSGQSGPDCSQTRAGIWSRAGVTYDVGTDLVYFSTGNGAYNPGAHHWGDTVGALHPNGTGNGAGDPVDTYTPANFQSLENGDTDLGSTPPAILPSSTNKAFPHLAVQGGKDGVLRLINTANLSGQNGPGHTGGEIGSSVNVPQGGGVFSDLGVWVDSANTTWIFVTTGNGVSGLKVGTDSGGRPTLVPQWKNSTLHTSSSPTIANGVLYIATGGSVSALNATTGAQLFSASIGGIHWETPIVINGKLYVTDGNRHLTAFAPA